MVPHFQQLQRYVIMRHISHKEQHNVGFSTALCDLQTAQIKYHKLLF